MVSIKDFKNTHLENKAKKRNTFFATNFQTIHWEAQQVQAFNKPGTAKVDAKGSESTKFCRRGDPSGFSKLQFVAKYEKNEGGPFVEFGKKIKKWDFWTV